MFYVYCPRLSNGAKELTEALGAQRLRNFDGKNFWRKKSKVFLKEGDTVVCWGAELPDLDGVKMLNNARIVNKSKENDLLTAAAVPTVVTSKNNPKALGGTWLPRKNNHVGGNDLLNPAGYPDFWVRKEELVNEYRIHSFNGRAMRSGKKIPRVANPHKWIRSYDAGWRIDYDGFESTETMRKIAKTAVKALGLTFGAVDIGEKADGSLIVLEVNRAPGLEGNTITKYAEAIQKWQEKGLEPEGENGVPFKIKRVRKVQP